MSILQTIDLKKQYGAGPNITRALDGVNLSVEQGEFVFLIGSSGAGKTTLLHLMGGELAPDEGTVFLNGANMARMIGPWHRKFCNCCYFKIRT